VKFKKYYGKQQEQFAPAIEKKVGGTKRVLLENELYTKWYLFS
jgi:hypothetical protein